MFPILSTKKGDEGGGGGGMGELSAPPQSQPWFQHNNTSKHLKNVKQCKHDLIFAIIVKD